jgi:hypothetical protein
MCAGKTIIIPEPKAAPDVSLPPPWIRVGGKLLWLDNSRLNQLNMLKVNNKNEKNTYAGYLSCRLRLHFGIFLRRRSKLEYQPYAVC